MTYPQLMQLANACGESQALLAANDLDVFTVIGTGGRTAGEVAKGCKADPEGMLLLLNALAGLGLLSRRGTRYHTTPLGRRYLDRRSPTAISRPTACSRPICPRATTHRSLASFTTLRIDSGTPGQIHAST